MRITFVASVSSTSYHQQQQEQEQQREQQQQEQQHDDNDNDNNHNDSSSLSILEEIVNIAMDAAITKLNDIELAKTIQYGKDNIIIKQMNSNQNHKQQQQQQMINNNNNNYDNNNHHHQFIMSLYQISQDLLQLNQKKKSSSSLPSSENENEQIALQILHSLANTAQHIPSYVSLGTIYYDKYQRTRGAHEQIPEEEEDEINDEQDDYYYYLKRSLDYFLLADEHHSDGGHQASLYNAGRIYLEMNMFPHAVAYIRAAAVFQYNDNNDYNNKKMKKDNNNNNNRVQISDLTRTCRNAYETLLSQLSHKISSTLSIEEIADIFMYSSKLPSLSLLFTNEQSGNDNNNNNNNQKKDDYDFPQAGSIEAQLFTNGILSMKQYYDNNHDSTPNSNSKTNIDLLSVAVSKFRTLWETNDDDDEDTTTTITTTNKQQRIMSSLQVHILLSLINECYNELLKLMMHNNNNNNDNIDNDDDHKKTELLLLMAAKYSETLATSSTYCYNDMYNINTTDPSKFHHDHKKTNNNNLIMNMRKRRMEKLYLEVEGDNDYNNGCFNYAISNAIHLYRQYYSTKNNNDNNNNNDSNHNDDDHIRRVMNIANNHPKSSSSTITFSDDGTPTTTTSSWIDDLNQ